MKQIKNKEKTNQFRINEEIRGYEHVRIVGENIDSTVVSLIEARRIAESMCMDIIEINNNVTPPILRICKYDKFIYEQKKKEKSKKQKIQSIKEIVLSVSIASNDLNTKANKAREFIEDGHKVKVTLKMKGRELNRREENKRSIFEFINILSDVAVAESMPKDENNRTIVILKKKK